MKVTIAELKEVSNRLFQHLEELGIEVINIDNDYYWNVPKEQLYNPYAKPGDLDLGQLSDDWNDLQRALNGESDLISDNLIDLAAIIKAIGEIVIV